MKKKKGKDNKKEKKKVKRYSDWTTTDKLFKGKFGNETNIFDGDYLNNDSY